MNLPDDIIIHDNEDDVYAGNLTPVSNLPVNFGEGDVGSVKSENIDDEGNFSSPQAAGTGHDSRHAAPRHNGGHTQIFSQPTNSLQSPMSAPDDHLSLLADQTLATLRDLIISRHRSGNSLQEIFQHFDRDAKGYFDVHDFIRAASDLRIEISEHVAVPTMSRIAIDGIDKATLGEFVVFVTDIDHVSLEHNVRTQVATLLERETSEESFLTRMYEVFGKKTSTNKGREMSSQALCLPLLLFLR